MAILKADPEYRRKWLLLLAAVAMVGFGATLWGLPALMEYLQEREPSDAIRFIQVLLVILFAPLLPMAYYLYHVAKRIRASGRFPPPETKVIRDTEIREGRAAKRTANLFLVVSVFLTIAALIGMIYIPYMIGKIGD